MGREVITLQVGNFANYVGAHYWNIQDEAFGLAETEEGRIFGDCLDASILFRQAWTAQQGVTHYVPRAVMLDLSGSLGGTSAAAFEGQTPPSSAAAIDTWGGGAEVHRVERIPRSSFVEHLDLETDDVPADRMTPLEQAARQLQAPGSVRYWTDFLKLQLHPKGVYEVPGLWHGSANLEGFGGGAEILRSADAREEVADRIRFFAEDCDSLQGFQCMADDLGGWGQTATDLLHQLQDDYPGSPVMLYAVRQRAACTANPSDPGGAMQLRTWQLSEALSYALLAPAASTYAPVAPPSGPAAAPFLRLPLDSEFRASGAIAAALDTTSLPYRLRAAPPTSSLGQPTGVVDMNTLSQLFQFGPASGLAALRVALPAPPLPADAQADAAEADARQQQECNSQQRHDSRPQQSIVTAAAVSWTPGVRAASGDTLAESVVLRGARYSNAAATVDQAAAILDASLLREGVRCVQQRCVAPVPLPVPLPFPHLFLPVVSRYGDVPMAAAAAAASAPARAASGSSGPQDKAAARQTPAGAADGPVSVPALTRLTATSEFRQVLLHQRRQLDSAAASPAGRALLSAWGLARDELDDARERLAGLASGFADNSSDSDS